MKARLCFNQGAIIWFTEVSRDFSNTKRVYWCITMAIGLYKFILVFSVVNVNSIEHINKNHSELTLIKF